MAAVAVAVPGVPAGTDVSGADLTGLPGEGKNLVAAALDGAGLVNADVARIRRDHTLKGTQHRVQHRGVGLGPADEKPDIRIRRPACVPDLRAGGFGKRVVAVDAGLHQIGFQHAPENGGMGTLVIVTGKIQSFAHGKDSFQMVCLARNFMGILRILYLLSDKSTTAISCSDRGTSGLLLPLIARHGTEQRSGIFTIGD